MTRTDTMLNLDIQLENHKLMRIKYLFICTLAGFISGHSPAQSPLPGGVGGAKIWFATEKSADQLTGWMDKLSGKPDFVLPSNSPSPAAGRLLNFNPALFFGGGQNGIQLPLGGDDYSKSTCFSVYQPEDTLSEMVVWSQEENTLGNLVLTDRRIADLADIKYMNFANRPAGKPAINTYTQFKEKGNSSKPQVLWVGNRPGLPVLPATPFRGIIPELILYNRVLTNAERARVESYLALKYGLTLSPLGTEAYLNASGEHIWDFKTNRQYSYNIAGVGRDDLSGFYQKQSESSYTPGLLVLGIGAIFPDNTKNHSQIENNSFHIWGDNNAPLDFEPKEQGQSKRLQRKWLMATYGQASDLKTVLKFDPGQVAQQAKRGELWWLIIDHSGTGQYPLGAVSYYPARETSEKGQLFFEGIQWDTDHSGTDVFTFGTGSPMIPKVWVTAPICTPPSDGQLHIGAEGGRPPYHFVLTNRDSVIIREWIATSNTLQTIDDIAPGDYRLSIRDADAHGYQEALFVQSSDAPVCGLNKQYELKPGQLLRLDAFAGIQITGVSCHWSGPDGFEINAPAVTISVPGTYQLTLEQAGCISRQKIVVTQYQQNVFEEVMLYPNPTADGQFTLAVDLHRTADVEVRIFDAAGRFITGKTLTGADRYRYTGQLQAAGTYTINLRSEQVMQTLPLLVN